MRAARIVGLDLAWGERNGDGVCLLAVDASGKAEIAETAHVFGDAALFGWLEEKLPAANAASVLFCLDAPVVCPNETGSRPVDRLAQRMFARFHAGPHPANRARCARVLRVVEQLRARLGGEVGWELRAGGAMQRLVIEVFPHPALVRMLELPRIVRYKRKAGRSAEFCASEFARLQGLLCAWLATRCPELSARDLPALAAPWNKPNEDQLDAVVCALVGYWHWRHAGDQSEVIGDAATGFILLPSASGAGPTGSPP